MRTLFDPATLQNTLARLESLQPDSPRHWGKMDVGQMMAHCSQGLAGALGDEKPPRALMGRLLGSFLKGGLTNDKPFAKNTPTVPTFLMADARDFAREKARLIALVQRFGAGGEAGVTTHPHPFFGKLTPREWGGASAKHLDHHLRQFGA